MSGILWKNLSQRLSRSISASLVALVRIQQIGKKIFEPRIVISPCRGNSLTAFPQQSSPVYTLPPLQIFSLWLPVLSPFCRNASKYID